MVDRCKLFEVTVLKPRVLSVTLPDLNENKLSYDCNAIRLLVKHTYTKEKAT